MINFILIGVCILAGFLFRQAKIVPADAHKGINTWIIYLALPAVSFKYLPFIHWNSTLLIPALAPLILWLGGWWYVELYNLRARVKKDTKGVLKLSSGLSNTSFIGFPLVMAYFNENALGTAIICDQATFILLSTVGVIVAINASGSHELSPKLIVNRLIRFPPFLACIIALTLPHFIDFTPMVPFFDKLAVTVGPLALFSIGLQLQFSGWRKELKHLSAALIYKLILGPALVLAVVLLVHAKGQIPQISIFEVAMPTLVTSGVVADEYNINPRLSSLIIGISIVFALGTTALWWWWLLKTLL